MNFYKVVLTGLCLCHMSSISKANGMASQLQKYFEKAGGGSNMTAPSVYKNQAAGYYSGGSFYGRLPVENMQLMNIQMPGFRAGCGGIDAWMGGFSHISGEDLMKALRSIMANMGSYAFMISLEAISPEIYNVMNELNALAQKINNLNINTCEAAATALGGMLPQSDATSKHLCQSMGNSLGGLSDWTAARHKCGVGGDRHKILDNDHESVKDTFKDEFNLVWQAIQKNGFLSNDKRLSELFMTLAGSIIIRRDGESYKTIHLKSKSVDQSFINAVLQGGTVEIYSCGSDHKCLKPDENVTKKEIISIAHDALVSRVQKMLNAIVDKIYSDSALDVDTEVKFLNSTTLPIYKILNVLTAYKKGHAPLEISSYAELIALDLLNHFLLSVLDIVENSITQLRKAQVSDVAIKEYMESLMQVRSLIIQQSQSAMAHMNATLAMIKSVQIVEKQLHVYLGTVSTSDESNWSM